MSTLVRAKAPGVDGTSQSPLVIGPRLAGTTLSSGVAHELFVPVTRKW